MEQGLTSQQAEEQQKQFGTNEIILKKRLTTISLFLSQFPTAMNGILVAAAILSLLLQNFLDGGFIFAILLINGLFGFFQEYRAQKALEKLKEYAAPLAKVIRDGKTKEIAVNEIVTGDVVQLQEGDRIPADGILQAGYHIEVDESILTGESIPVEKSHGHQLFRGTFIARGKGVMHVEKIGMQTKFGEIAKTLANIQTPTTPLQQQVSSLSKMLSIIILLLSFLLIPIGFFQGRELIPMVLIAVSLAVAAIPESLPGVITIALAVGANRLAKKKAIVKKMSAVETLGTTQIILTDKTGTLTQNNMEVKDYFLTKKSLLPHGLEACMRGNNAFITKESGETTIVGEKTDGALLLWARKMDGKYKDVLEKGDVVDEYSFDANTKTITTIVKKHGTYFVFVRGAPEKLLEISKVTKREKNELLAKMQDFASKGLRVIALAYKEDTNKIPSRKEAENSLTFVGLVGLYDAPREETHEALTEAARGGIRVVMVTGDNELTALAIAKEVGLVTENETAVIGEQMKQMSDDELFEALQKTHVFARVAPEQKLRLVDVCKKNDVIVGVTGDGVNDSLALEKADVGIAMGKIGSDVAKEASDLVLANDDIYTLIRAVMQGRRIYENIVTAVTYLLAGNLSEITLVFLATIFDQQLILLPTQILWMNLVTDGLPALALASEDHSVTSFTRDKPRDAHAYLLSEKRIAFIAIVGTLLGSVFFLLFSFLTTQTTVTRARTITFTLFIVAQLFLAFIVRRKLFLKAGKALWLSVVLTILAQIAITTIPIFQEIFHLGW